MNNDDLQEVLDSELWANIKERLNNEKEQLKTDLVGLDFTDPKTIFEGVRLQARLEMIGVIDGIIADIKEVVRKKENENAED